MGMNLTPHETKDGYPIKFRVFRNFKDNGINSLWTLHKIVPYVEGKAAGYLKIAYVPGVHFFTECPDIWSFLSKVRGHLGFKRDNPARMWQMIHLSAHERPLSKPNIASHMLSSLDAPSDPEVFEADLNHVLSRNPAWARDYAEFVAWQVDKPYVDFIRVEKPYQRRGIGKALYIRGAEWLAQELKLPLYASGLQQPEAKAAWDRLIAEGYPIVEDWQMSYGELKKRLRLDFRMVPESNRKGILAA